jgi:hypothetical protein
VNQKKGVKKIKEEMTAGPYIEIWERVKKITGWSNENELEKFLGMTGGNRTQQKGSDRFLLWWARAIAKEYGVSTDWIMGGEGPMEVKETKEEYRMEYKGPERRVDHVLRAFIEKAIAVLRSDHFLIKSTLEHNIEALYEFYDALERRREGPKST